MSDETRNHLCLSDLLQEELSAWEYFNTLPHSVKQELERKDVRSFEEMQELAGELIRGDSSSSRYSRYT